MQYRSCQHFHPLCFNSARFWWRLIARHGLPDPPFWDRALAATLIAPLTSPFRVAERLRHRRAIESTPIEHDPLFILGHWRSGTTLLQQFLNRDPNLGQVTLFQSLAPTSYFVGQRTLKPLMAWQAPTTRPMDNVAIDMDVAQEEEFAVANMCPQSLYVGFYFARAFPELFDRYVLMRGLSEADRDAWRRNYLYTVKTATRASQGRRLLLKSPPNTGRIPALLELFPNAKFVYIVRNPYKVYPSTLHLHREVLAMTSVQRFDDAFIERNVLRFYRELLQQYLADRHAIPDGNLVEIRYEDLDADPLATVQSIYDGLALSGWDAVRPGVEAHVDATRDYKKNVFEPEPNHARKVEAHWAFALDEWDYARPEVYAAAE